MSELLEVSDLSKNFGGLKAIASVSFSVKRGEILGLIGPNGAGKSTVFNLINGVFPPSKGKIVFDGQDITGLPPYKVVHRGIARTHQIVKPLNDMTVLDNCMVGACFGRENVSLVQAREVADEVITFLGIANHREMLAAHLTIAGKKRLEVARALCARPMLLLLDEVLAGLNLFEVDQMIDIVRQIRDRGVSILIIEHLMQAIMSLSDRIVVLNFGEKLAEGRPQEVANDPVVAEAYFGDPEMAKKLAREG